MDKAKITMLKQCTQCKKQLEVKEFYKRKTGLYSNCKCCMKNRVKEWRKKNPKTIRVKQKTIADIDKRCLNFSKLRCTPLEGIKLIYKEQNRLRKQQKKYIATLNRQSLTPSDKVRNQQDARLIRDWGITLKQYESMLKEQDFKCAVCLIPESEHRRKLAIDHCHSTGKIRGLLCLDCNTAIGKLGDTVEGVKRALIYLNK